MASILKVIGKNQYKELGNRDGQTAVHSLVDVKICETANITNVISCDDFAIYCDENYETLFSAGYNENGIYI